MPKGKGGDKFLAEEHFSRSKQKKWSQKMPPGKNTEFFISVFLFIFIKKEAETDKTKHKPILFY